MAEKTTADIGFEKQIWDAACVLRGIWAIADELRGNRAFIEPCRV